MCIIKEFDIIHPDGRREPKRSLHHCHNGSPISPCNAAVTRRTRDRFVALPEPAPMPGPLSGEVEPRREKVRKSRKFVNGLKMVIDFHVPFTSRKPDKKKKKGVQKAPTQRAEGGRRHSPPPSPYPQHPWQAPLPHTPFPHAAAQMPLQRSPEMTTPNARPRRHTINPRRDHPLNVEIHPQNSSSSPSPDTPLRQRVRHHRRTESAEREYEIQKRLIRERERRQNAERVAQDAENARVQAERDADRAYEEQQRLLRERDRREHAERAAIAENVRLRRERNAERVRRNLAEGQRCLRYEERRRIESAERRRRRIEREEWEVEQARLRQLQEDQERMQAAALRNDTRRAWEEHERRERLRRSNIPFRPRHRPTVNQHPRPHGHVSLAERANRVINDAIQAGHERRYEAEQRRRSWHRAPAPDRGWQRRRDVGGGLRRRDTIAVGQRQVYNDDRMRGGRRFVWVCGSFLCSVGRRLRWVGSFWEDTHWNDFPLLIHVFRYLRIIFYRILSFRFCKYSLGSCEKRVFSYTLCWVW